MATEQRTRTQKRVAGAPRSADADRVTILMVAQAAGVSAPTVSKVLNGRETVGPETRRRVQDALISTGYQRRTRSEAGKVGVVDFDINDKAGYKTEEYVSPADGRTYHRQVLVESTGFVFDIDLAVFDADSGELLLEENFRDFKEFDQRNYDEILGLFENLRALETQLVGIFVAQEMSGTRYVFTE